MITDSQRETTGVLLRLTRPMLDALDRMEMTTGTDRTNYIRQSVWRALVQDGFAVVVQPDVARSEAISTDC